MVQSSQHLQLFDSSELSAVYHRDSPAIGWDVAVAATRRPPPAGAPGGKQGPE
jgi:hypothetical protein